MYKKISVAHVLDVCEDSLNGAVISSLRFIHSLRDAHVDVWVVSTGTPEEKKVVLKKLYLPIVKNIMKKMKFVFAVPDRKKIRNVLHHVDIVHNQFPFWLGLVTIQEAKKLNKKVVSTFHVQGEQITHNAGLKNMRWTRWTYRYMVKYIYNRSDMVICPSAFAERELKSYGLTSPSIVISNGVPNWFVPATYPPPHADSFFHVITVGRNAVEKRQDLLIRAIAQSTHKHKIKLHIIGDGPNRKNLESLSHELLVVPTEFKTVAPENIVHEYQQADLYIHTASCETECMSIMEAMACGIPCVIAKSEKSAASQFALDTFYLFETVEQLTEKLDYLFTHVEKLKTASIQTIQKAQEYTHVASTQKLITCYYDVLGIKEKPTRAIHEQATEFDYAPKL